MLSTDLGACEWFIWDLRRSNLIDRGRLDQVVGEFLKKQPRAEPPALAEYLVSQGILSRFQVDCLLKGKTQGLVLGPYTLNDTLGTGSMGTVYRAVSKTDGKAYAVKVLPRRSMWNVRIARRLVRSFDQCKHPAVVPFVDVGTAGGTHYLAWPLVEGEALDKMVQREGKLAPDVAALYGLQTAEGLDVCHQHGLVHGLIKPSNLMVGTDGQVRILDFGIGSLLSETEGESLVDTMSTANSLTSGLDCASPESILEPTNRTPAGDQYSLGCTLYYFLTGRYPFPEGSTVEKMMAHQSKEPPPIQEFAPDVPGGLVEVVSRLMRKTQEERYPSTSDVVEALRPFAAESGPAPVVVSRPAAAPTVAPPGRETRPEPGRPRAPVSEPRTAPEPPRSAAPARSLRQQMFEQPPTATSLPALSEPEAEAPAVAPEQQAVPTPDYQQVPGKSLEDRIGPWGIIIIGLIIAAVAGFALWQMGFFK